MAGPVLAALVLAGCSGPTSRPASTSSAPPSESIQATSVATAADSAPKVGNCYRLAYGDLAQPTSAAPAVACSTKHTSVTVAVLQNLRPSQVETISTACTKAVRQHIGATPLQMATTMVQPVWFVPSSSAEGWVRCDMVLYAAAGQLAALPKRTANLWKRDPASVGTCSPAAPGTKGFDRVLCGSGTPWRVLVALPIPGSAYPGVKTLRTNGDYRCSDAVRLALNLALKYTYGYEWPTKAQWQAGDHRFLCWSMS